MSFPADRLAGAIALRGETFTSGGSSAKGFFSVITASQAAAFLPYSLAISLTAPIFQVLLPASSTLEVTDTLDWNGRTFTVESILRLRSRDATIGVLAVIA
ncbi:MAG: hypothetical protein K8R88_07485 [Armatimonadetes bacterium]|nr:hypothetical protein [Armatimonadota bacterium]